MTSESSGGASVITLQFSLSLNLDVAEQQVQAAINAASNLLPADLPAPPVYSKVNPADAPIMTLAIMSKTLSLTDLQDISETRIAQKIAQQSGVGQVAISGANGRPFGFSSIQRARRVRPQYRRSAHNDRQRDRQQSQRRF